MLEKPSARRFTLVQRLIGSYAAVVVFSMAATCFSIFGLYSLNGIVRDIARNDFAFMRSAEGLRDSIEAQKRNAAKYSVLKSKEFKELYYLRRKEFIGSIDELKITGKGPLLDNLINSYRVFSIRAEDLFAGETEDITHLKEAAEKVDSAIEALYMQRQNILNDKLKNADNEREKTVKWTVALSFAGFFLALGVTLLFIITISSSIRKLKHATHLIAGGNFDFDPQIPPGDEIGDLAQDFTHMASRLKTLEQMSLDASPLTRLPGNIAIERVLTKKLHAGETFAVCYADLDNFKAYSDRYGYIRGSDLIKMTGETIHEAVQRHADENAFVGHIGGDDFVMIISCNCVDEVCKAVIKDFTERVPEFYSPEDLANGAIEGVDRYGVQRVFPIMTISIAVVTCQQGEYDSATIIAKTAAEIKEFTKGMEGSNYFIDRRRTAR
ncbi:MAG: diguanylate cyclase [Geobacteraceae bacterium]|nr:diguanylate cyclase [Geobacteraceae bacterium]